MAKKIVTEKEELVWRIIVGIVTGIVLCVWRFLVIVLVVVHFFVVLFTNKRDKKLADFCEIWNSEVYRYIRYLTFETNERPFPFSDMKTLGRFEK